MLWSLLSANGHTMIDCILKHCKFMMRRRDTSGPYIGLDNSLPFHLKRFQAQEQSLLSLMLSNCTRWGITIQILQVNCKQKLQQRAFLKLFLSQGPGIKEHDLLRFLKKSEVALSFHRLKEPLTSARSKNLLLRIELGVMHFYFVPIVFSVMLSWICWCRCKCPVSLTLIICRGYWAITRLNI